MGVHSSNNSWKRLSVMRRRGCVPDELSMAVQNILQKVPCTHCYTQCPQPCRRPPPTHASAGVPGHSQASLGQSLVGSLLLSPRSWCTRFCLCPPGVYFPDHLQINNGWINKTTISKNKGVFLVPKRTLLKVPLVVSFL